MNAVLRFLKLWLHAAILIATWSLCLGAISYSFFIAFQVPKQISEYHRTQNASTNETAEDTASDTIADWTIILAIFTGVLAAASIAQGVFIKQQIELAREEFRTTHRPKIGIRGFDIAFEGVTGDHMHPCSFTVFNEGSGTAFIREINAVLINGESCWNQMGRRVQFRNPDTKDRVLAPGADELYFTRKDFFWDNIDSNWFLVGFVRYSDSASNGIERKTGFCRRWVRPVNDNTGDIYRVGNMNIGAMHWTKENNEYEYSY